MEKIYKVEDLNCSKSDKVKLMGVEFDFKTFNKRFANCYVRKIEINDDDSVLITATKYEVNFEVCTELLEEQFNELYYLKDQYDKTKKDLFILKMKNILTDAKDTLIILMTLNEETRAYNKKYEFFINFINYGRFKEVKKVVATCDPEYCSIMVRQCRNCKNCSRFFTENCRLYNQKNKSYLINYWESL